MAEVLVLAVHPRRLGQQAAVRQVAILTSLAAVRVLLQAAGLLWDALAVAQLVFVALVFPVAR